jgi:metal-responsive CopG/Arc/MetJ family transcriptional regulator
MEKKDVRIQLVISPSEIEALDEWRAKQRIWSRSEAIRRLVARGIEEDQSSPAKQSSGS